MTNTSPELIWAAKEREYRANQKIANRQLLMRFVFVLALLVLAVAVGTLLANIAG